MDNSYTDRTEDTICIYEAVEVFSEEFAVRNSSDDARKLVGISTGFAELDKLTSGLRPGSLTVIAGRPVMGKSTLALNIATHVASNEDLPVLMFSMRISAVHVATRMIRSLGKVSRHTLESAMPNEAERKNVEDAIELLKNVPLMVVETPSLTVEKIISITLDCIEFGRMVNLECEKFGLIVIDRLDLIEMNGSGQDYDSVMSALKKFASESGTPIILLSGVKPDTGPHDKIPRWDDLPAPAVGNYADVLCFLYRDDCFKRRSEHEGTALLYMLRNRFGFRGAVMLSTSELAFSKFS
jgi:replicative DNA helicase